ncbi:MAG: anthranilate/aminodeoxychorismate synthase component II [Klebsiella michiganensis]|nr:anthranilate/aminodeoxychorismate synthase component II [Klebsiella michiganensis]
MILLIDNYDSFTWNLYQYFCELGAEVLVRRNDELTLADIISLAPAKIVISPGPCTPDESGISLAAIRHFSGQTPILGVCLGHQAIAQVFGAAIVRAAKVMHGKTSPVSHTGQGVFLGLNNPLTVTRYHSLLIDPLTLPECFEVTARSEEGEIMGIRHRVFDLEGVQFRTTWQLNNRQSPALHSMRSFCRFMHRQNLFR